MFAICLIAGLLSLSIGVALLVVTGKRERGPAIRVKGAAHTSCRRRGTEACP
jgi:hypothetical protein